MDRRLQELKKILADAAAGMSAEQLRWHPPGKWCAAEVLEHLYLTYTATIKGFERVLEAGKPLAGSTSTMSASLKHRFATLLVLDVGYLPSGRKAPKMAQPRGLPAETVRAEMEAKIAAMDETIARCEEKIGKGKLLDHPILGPLTATQWRKFHLVHGRHHAKQIRRLRQQTRSVPR